MVDMGYVHGLEKARDLIHEMLEKTDKQWWDNYNKYKTIEDCLSDEALKLSEERHNLVFADNKLIELHKSIIDEIEAVLSNDAEAV